MNISDCLDQQMRITDLNTTFGKNLTAYSLEEIELLDSIAKLLYKTKSVRSAVNILDRINQVEDLTEIYGLSTKQLIFGYDENKPIGYTLKDRRSVNIIHNHLNLGDFNSNIEHENNGGC